MDVGRRAQLRALARRLIAASVAVGVLAICVRAAVGGAPAQTLEGATLFLAAAAALAHVVARHDRRRELLIQAMLVTAFALWGVVQIAPTLPGVAVLNDIVILLFVADLAILVSTRVGASVELDVEVPGDGRAGSARRPGEPSTADRQHGPDRQPDRSTRS